MFGNTFRYDYMRRLRRRQYKLTRSRPVVEGLEARQLLSLNAFSVPGGTATVGITRGSDGNLWFTGDGNNIGRMTPTGKVTEFPIPTGSSGAGPITLGPDGDVYFVETEARQIGRITPTGVISEFSLSGDNVTALGGITAGPDGNVYFFASSRSYEVGRITPSGQISFLSLHAGGPPNGAAIATGPDGNLWVPLAGSRTIVRLSPSGATKDFTLPSGVTGVGNGITAGPGGLWFTGDDFTNGGGSVSAFVGRITTAGVATIFRVPTTDALLAGIAAGNDGNIYFAATSNFVGPGSGVGLAQITPKGVITELPIPSSGGVAKGPDGNIWVTEDGKIAQFVLDGKAAYPNVHQFGVPGGMATVGITKGSDGNLWFTGDGNNIGRITPAGNVTEFPIPTGFGGAGPITLGHDGNVYFAESEAVQIGRITPKGLFSEFSLSVDNVNAVGGIAAGPDGNVYFFASSRSYEVGRITPSGQISFLSLHTGGPPASAPLTTGPDGNIWVALSGAIVRLTTAGATTVYSLPRPAGGFVLEGGITAGPDGNLWFTGNNATDGGATVTGFIGRITTKGVITEFPLPTRDSFPGGITAGPDGNLYFTETSSGSGIGRITTSGVITEIPVPSGGGITAGPDGNIWLNEDGMITQYVLTTASTAAAASPAPCTSQAAIVDAVAESLPSLAIRPKKGH
jgi:streptogramin lyase